MSEFSSELLAELKKLLNKRDYLVLLVLILLEPAGIWVIHQRVTLLLILTIALPIDLGLWYVWVSYQKRLQRGLSWISVICLSLLSFTWIYGVWKFYTADRDKIDQLLKSGRDRVNGLNYAGAKRDFEEAASIAHAAGNKSAEGTALCDLGQVQGMQGELEKARLSLLSCISIASDRKLNKLKATGYVALGELEVFYAPYAARQDLQRALGAAREAQDAKHTEGVANELLGNLAKNLGQINEAYQFYQNASMLFRDTNDPYEMSTLLDTGELKTMQGRFKEARWDYNTALEYYRKAPLGVAGQATTLVFLGDLERLAGDNREARQDYLNAIGLSDQDPDGKANAILGLAELEHKLGHFKESRKDFGDALILYQRVKDEVGQGNTLVGLCRLETLAGEFSQASHDLDEASKASSKDDYPLGNANALLSAADLNRERGNFDEARQFYSDALSSYKDLGAPLGEAGAWLGLGQLERKQGNSDAAGQGFAKAWSLYEQEQIQIGEAEVQFNRGELERVRKHYAVARGFYEDTLAKYAEEDARDGQAKVLLGMGDLEREIGSNANNARQYYGRARGLYQEQSSLIGEANVDLSESELLTKQGTSAAPLLERAHESYVAMGMREKVDEVEQLQRGRKVLVNSNPAHGQ